MRSLITSFLMIMCVVFAGAAQADVAVATLDAGTIPGGVVCGQVWAEAELDLSFIAQTTDDCSGGGPCFFGEDPTRIWLFPARLSAHLNVAGVITAAEVDTQDFCGVGCTRIFLYNGNNIVAQAGNTLGSTPETLSVNSGGAAVTHVAISSCEAIFEEIRVTYDPPLPTEPTTWGAVKALFE